VFFERIYIFMNIYVRAYECIYLVIGIVPLILFFACLSTYYDFAHITHIIIYYYSSIRNIHIKSKTKSVALWRYVHVMHYFYYYYCTSSSSDEEEEEEKIIRFFSDLKADLWWGWSRRCSRSGLRAASRSADVIQFSIITAAHTRRY